MVEGGRVVEDARAVGDCRIVVGVTLVEDED